MWKQRKESGVSLAELLVVLAITVVLAAILLPAVNSPYHSGDNGPAAVGLTPYVVAAESPPVTNRSRTERHRGSESDAPAVDDTLQQEVAEIMPAFDGGEPETLERDGLKKFRTTDISYKLP